jgi:glucosamine-6-phosphate deaminase
MGRPSLFAVGDMCVDVLQKTSSQAVFGEERALDDLSFSIGGNAANFAVVAGKLGLNPILVSATGTDFATRFLRDQLSDAGVRSRMVKSKRQNAFSSIAVNKAGERAIQSVKNCLCEMTARRVERMLLPGLSDGDIVFFGGFFHLENMRPGFRRLLAKVKGRHAVVCFDTCFDTLGVWDISRFLPFIDYLFVNEVELKHIAKGGSAQARLGFLLQKGASAVVLKQGAGGAAIFRRHMKPAAVKAVRSKAVDTTGAGDAFNAGFVFGLTRGWSLQNSALAGNFVAAHKVRHHGPAAPAAGSVERFITSSNMPTLVVEKDYASISRAAASIVANLLKQKPDASIALPTGETPKQLYNILVQESRKGRISFKKARFFAIDEYAGLPQKDRNSFSHFLRSRFLDGVKADRRNTFLLNGASRNLKKECADHEAAIRKRGIDLCILGIGRNGHIGFNEPGSMPGSTTRIVELKNETRRINGRHFPGRLAPPRAITIGLKTIMNSRQILLLAHGKRKAKAVRAAITGRNNKKWPAASLRPHKNVTMVLDRAAYGK